MALYYHFYDVFVLLDQEEGLLLCGERGFGHEGNAAVRKRDNRCHFPGVYLRCDFFDIDWIVWYVPVLR